MMKRLEHDPQASKRRAAMFQAIVTWILIFTVGFLSCAFKAYIIEAVGEKTYLVLLHCIGAIGGLQAAVVVYRWRGLNAEPKTK